VLVLARSPNSKPHMTASQRVEPDKQQDCHLPGSGQLLEDMVPARQGHPETGHVDAKTAACKSLRLPIDVHMRDAQMPKPMSYIPVRELPFESYESLLLSTFWDAAIILSKHLLVFARLVSKLVVVPVAPGLDRIGDGFDHLANPAGVLLDLFDVHTQWGLGGP
jgi:hypothetical protein